MKLNVYVGGSIPGKGNKTRLMVQRQACPGLVKEQQVRGK